METAIFGIENDGLNLAVNLLVLVLAVLWIALVYWTFQDARRRLTDPVLIGSSVAASVLFPFVGTIAYSIVRPPEYLEDVQERAMEAQAAELRLAELKATGCPRCEHRPIHQNFLLCPACGYRLKVPCPSCSRPVAVDWRVCPFCEIPLRRRKASGDRTRRVKGDGERAEPQRAPPKRSRRPAPAGAAQGREGPERPEGGEQRQGGGKRQGGGERTGGEREVQGEAEGQPVEEARSGRQGGAASDREERQRRRQAARK